jgi:GDPmannose 4,6-dehydratase
VSAFRDWSHISDIIDGYLLLTLRGLSGEVYNQGSQRTNSVLSYILLSLSAAKKNPLSLQSVSGSLSIEDPAAMTKIKHFGPEFDGTVVDKLLLEDDLKISLEHKGLDINTTSGKVRINFDSSRFRPSDVPILLASTEKISKIGFEIKHSLTDIINDQLNYYLDSNRRKTGS